MCTGVLGVCALLLALATPASGVLAPTMPMPMPVDSASLTQCLTTGEPAERSATFAGEMSTVAGATRMSMRIELLEQGPGESRFHTVAAPGLGVWRTADPGVGVYKYVKQVTDLSAPAVYRGLVTFRWQNAHGHTLKREERRTRRCSQPPPVTPPPSTSPTPSGSSANSPSGSSAGAPSAAS